MSNHLFFRTVPLVATGKVFSAMVAEKIALRPDTNAVISNKRSSGFDAKTKESEGNIAGDRRWIIQNQLENMYREVETL